MPLLLAISDNGPQMRSYSTREFMAGVAIAQQFGRPLNPDDQAWIETLFGHVKGEWPHLEKISDPGELELELDLVRAEYNSVRLHASIGYVTPDDEHTAAARRSARPAATGWPRPANPHRLPSNHDQGKPMITTRSWLGISSPDWFIYSDTPHSKVSSTGQRRQATRTRVVRVAGRPGGT